MVRWIPTFANRLAVLVAASLSALTQSLTRAALRTCRALKSKFLSVLPPRLLASCSRRWHSVICGGRRQDHRQRWSGWSRLVFPLMSAVALAWFVCRVIPKPIRACYPCQQAAFPLASSFVIWLLGVKSGLLAWLDFKGRVKQVRPALTVAGLVCLLALAGMAATEAAKHLAGSSAVLASWNPSDPPNSPMGTAKGIFPGRVAWMRDTNATPWNGTSGNWWSDTTGINQAAVDRMISRNLRTLAGASSDAEAWDKVFRYHNSTRGRGNVGYGAGEKIAIKINCNNTANYADADNNADASPQSIIALLRQLVNQAGVPQTNITVYEAPNTPPSRVIPDRIYSRCYAQFPQVIYADCTGTSGRTLIQWTNNVITYSVANSCGRNIPTCVAQATYLVNLSLFKGHNTAGVTLTAKNHYGTINTREHTFIRASTSGLGAYSPFVDLIGHPHLGKKTLLFMMDGLYGCVDVGSTINAANARWTTLFGGQWSASCFMSLDPVAIDSVGVDFLRSEFGDRLGGGHSANCDSFLHEAAQAASPPSGTVYRPDGVNRLASLGVHEHWNNAVSRQYSRNLGTGAGIELVAVHSLAGLTVALTNPAVGAVFEAGAPIPLQVTFATNWSVARRVDFYRGASLVASSPNAPFTATWTNAPFGAWPLTAVATDLDGLRATSAVVNITVQSAAPAAPSILAHPANQVVMAGETAQFAVEASAWPAPAYQWRKDGTNLPGASFALLSLPNATPGQSGIYCVAVSNAVGMITSAPAGLAVLLPATNVSLIPTGALWRYHDKAQDLGNTWRGLTYDHASWSNGYAELGFGDAPGRPERTVIASNGQWTTYFRHGFAGADLRGLMSLQSRLLRDDGAVVYLNGTEIFRDNLTNTNIYYNTPALAACSDDGTAWLPTNVPLPLLRADTNVVAVEVHQNSLTSSDLSFNFELIAQRATEAPKIVTHPASQARLGGQSAAFRVEAASLLPMTCRWLFHGAPLPAETNTLLTLANLTTNHAGFYCAVVSNAVGAVTSAPASLVVVGPPILEASCAAGGGEFRLAFWGGGLGCTVFVSTNLSDWDVLTNLPPVTGPIEVCDPETAVRPSRFYRLRVNP